MNWKVAIIVLMLVQLAVEMLTKAVSDILPRKKALGIAYQFFFCFILALIFARVNGGFSIGKPLLFAGAVGLFNGINNYFGWQAYGISLSRTVLVAPLSGIASLCLAVIFLGEGRLWSGQVILGVSLSFLAMWLFRSDGERKAVDRKWFWYVVALLFISGTTTFFMKVLSLDQVSPSIFLTGWYAGSFVGILPLLRREGVGAIRLSARTALTIGCLSVTMVLALGLLYESFSLGGPVTLVVPLRGLGITLLPALAGWIYFKEGKGFGKREWAGSLLGLIGALLILFK